MARTSSLAPRPLSTLALLGLLALPAACEKSGGATQIPEGEVVHVLAATFAEGSHASEAVQTECGLQEKLPQYVERYSKGRAVFDADADPSSGRVIELTLTDVVAPAGGAFSGPKHMKVVARALQDGTEVDTFEIDRSTTAGGYGNCDMLARIAAALGKDVARWLPSVSFPASSPSPSQ